MSRPQLGRTLLEGLRALGPIKGAPELAAARELRSRTGAYATDGLR